MKLRTFALLIMIFSSCLTVCVLCSGNARADVKPKNTTNPPPKCEFSSYNKFIAESVVISEEFKEQQAKNREAARIEAEKSGSTRTFEEPKEIEVNVRAVAQIQNNLDNKLKPLLQSWNKDTQNIEVKPLIIKPRIESIYITTNQYGGKSIVLMRVIIVDHKTGEVIANPEFYQHANAFGAAYSQGATNNAMLNRVTDLVVQYMSDNYKNAVGGKTGAGK